jgi:NADH:ubiquinone reductase (H+-translocating)
MRPKKIIAILGAGFGGLACALKLEQLLKKARVGGVRIVLIDKNRYHTYIPALYEVASADPSVSEDALYHRVNILIRHILKRKKVEFLKAEVTSIDTKDTYITFADGNGIDYDYLVLAMGAQTNFSDIKGLQKYSLDLKNFICALKIRRAAKLGDEIPKRMVIGGGGTTGVELAAELHTCFRDAHTCPQITIINGQERILPKFPERVSILAQERLKKIEVILKLGSYIKEVTKSHVVLANKEKVPYDCLFWTGGICGHSLLEKLPFKKEKGFLTVDECLHPVNLKGKSQEDIFALGDVSVVYTSRGALVPWTAQKALTEGQKVAHNLFRLITGKGSRVCLPEKVQFIIPIGGKWAITKLNGMVHAGFLGWMLKNLVELKYLASILPWHRAVTQWLQAIVTFSKND